MKGIYFDGEKAVYREDLPLPVRHSGESLIKVLYAAVCSTDKEILRGYRPFFRGIMGHEFVGTVVESDDETLLKKRVVGEITAYCGECIYCRTGRRSHCSNRQTLGLTRDGCFAEYLVLPTGLLHRVPDSLPDTEAVYTEPLAAAFEILEQVDIEKGESVTVIGDGRLALCIANVIHMRGATLTVVGKHDEKLSLFKALGEVTKEVRNESAEIVIEASGSPSGFLYALRCVRKKGTIVLKSTFTDLVEIDLSRIPVDEITIVGSRCGPFRPALEALASSAIILPELEIYPLSDFCRAFSSTSFKAGFRIGC